jgi:hypothetical protein
LARTGTAYARPGIDATSLRMPEIPEILSIPDDLITFWILPAAEMIWSMPGT